MPVCKIIICSLKLHATKEASTLKGKESKKSANVSRT
jgi:hypothetical protein